MLGLGLTEYHSQLGREGQEEKDHWHWTHAQPEGDPKKVQEWLPDRCTKRFERTSRQGRISDASGTLSGLGTAADCLGAQGIWVILANAINGIQLQRQPFQVQVFEDTFGVFTEQNPNKCNSNLG